MITYSYDGVNLETFGTLTLLEDYLDLSLIHI